MRFIKKCSWCGREHDLGGLGEFLAALGSLFGRLGWLLGSLLGGLGWLLAALGGSGALLGRHLAVLGGSWAALGRSWAFRRPKEKGPKNMISKKHESARYARFLGAPGPIRSTFSVLFVKNL